MTTPAATALAATTNNGRDKIQWSQEVWDRIDVAVHDECVRTKVASKFLPIHPVQPRTTTVPSDIILPTDKNAQTLVVDEGATTRLFEIWVEFALTHQQLEQETGAPGETGSSTAVTLATRAANVLSQAEDLLIFQGTGALSNSLITDKVRHRGDLFNLGLLNLSLDAAVKSPLPPDQIIAVQPVTQGRYGENTFTAVALGYSLLQGKGQYGPYALVLQTVPYADTYAPLANTLIMPADRIKPLVTAGFYGTGTLFARGKESTLPRFTGLLVSLGGNTMDLVVGVDATTAFMQQDVDGAYRFRVLERFALRLKDLTAIIRLDFQ
jgi:uncharacterized linocin/CFP29 family protein